ncbi:endonuclease domain-containing protein [uncultured Sunxiuqinia sp.]|uniref:endonuclease domain-containing protein n=1 Tax=uncultured Sunxiuqinia sp. TaxID=1573825 RepID=UPI0026292E65|nr:endonuclease domain-containing protein [uncultured Sunxiuqinia sp.]
MVRLNNHNYLKNYRKGLRSHSTAAEASLWKLLKNKQVAKLKFRRQHSIGNYILDFYCPGLQLAIELDGETHAGYHAEEKDRERDAFMKQNGIEVLHFENRWVYEYPQDIIEEIEKVKERKAKK